MEIWRWHKLMHNADLSKKNHFPFHITRVKQRFGSGRGGGRSSRSGVYGVLDCTLRPGSDAVLHMSRIECLWGRIKDFSYLHSIRLMWSTASELSLTCNFFSWAERNIKQIAVNFSLLFHFQVRNVNVSVCLFVCFCTFCVFNLESLPSLI